MINTLAIGTNYLKEFMEKRMVMIGAAILPMLCMWIQTLPIVIDQNWIIDCIIDCTMDFRTG